MRGWSYNVLYVYRRTTNANDDDDDDDVASFVFKAAMLRSCRCDTAEVTAPNGIASSTDAWWRTGWPGYDGF